MRSKMMRKRRTRKEVMQIDLRRKRKNLKKILELILKKSICKRL
jgi:hypothetical protein